MNHVRFRHSRRSVADATGHPGRRGAFFSQVMVYLTLGSSLLLLGGVLLHSLMRADGADRRMAMLLSVLQQAEQRIRNDAESGRVRRTNDSELQIDADDGSIIRWSADRGILSRSVERSGTLESRDRMAFPAGTRVEMTGEEPDRIIVRITDPAPFSRTSGRAGGREASDDSGQVSPGDSGHLHSRSMTTEIHLRGDLQ